MKEQRNVVKNWIPEYPKYKDVKVKLLNCDFQTFISDRRPGINVTDYPVVAPVCFWIDFEHVYLRVNWSIWGSISLSSPEQVVALCNAHYCRIIYSTGNEIGECSAPVYRIAKLPEELFGTSKDEEKNGDSDSDSYASTKKNEFQQCVDKIKNIVKGKGLSVFPRCTLGGDCAPVVISNDEHAIIMDILPEERNFIFCSPEGKKRHQRIDNWPTRIVSLDFIEQLRNLKKTLAELEPDAIIDIGFLANGNTIKAIHSYLDMTADDISDLKLFSYDTLKIGISSLFSLLSREEIADKVKKIILEHMCLDPTMIHEDTVFIEDLGADDSKLQDLTIAFTEAFGCVFPEHALVDMLYAVGDVIDFIEASLG